MFLVVVECLSNYYFVLANFIFCKYVWGKVIGGWVREQMVCQQPGNWSNLESVWFFI